MRKVLTLLMSAVCMTVVFAGIALAAAEGAPSGALDIVNNFVAGFGGWAWIGIVVGSFAVIWVIRATKTTKDDIILDNYISKGIEYALKIMPANTAVNWIKLTKNALQEFIDVYAKEQGAAPDRDIYEKAKALIEEIAKNKELPKN